ncbi:hypothetical protein GCM10010503_41570 [Streptomyces lucensis JCM 4490]|uniref:Uncharacterized protein n=1 Tax=Streptomyces lucensis JCM 4490 TaxID=1306176 RepID=A0A918JA05_9ACTN|nr:hypothetical protein [Streptomyces lucensis]GGW60017.1 hypothetical protein GCM10010503_41570 [Streptomyces lucensis JCM 4490]
MATEPNSARITGKVQGRHIILEGPLSKDEIRDTVWWWQIPDPRTSKEREDRGHAYDRSSRDVIATLGGYYEVPGDSRGPEAVELVEMLHSELGPGR